MLSGAAAGAATLAMAGRSDGAATEPQPLRIVDSNISLFQWPFRRFSTDEPGPLLEQLKNLEISRAWAGSFEALLHRDIGGVNQRLATVCKATGNGRLIPIGAVNPMLPDWEEDLRRCHEEYRMPGIRLHPNYHGYHLMDDLFLKVLQAATERGLIVQLAAAMEDTRTHHPLVQVAEVDLTQLPTLVEKVSGARVQILNHRPRAAMLKAFAQAEGIFFDISRIEDTAGVARLMRGLPAGRVMFGSHTPFLIQQSALIRAHESDLTESETRDLFAGNAERLLGKETN